MAKLTLKKIAENTLRKVGRPLTTKEIWEEASRIGTVEGFVSSGKTPWATIGAYLYWSINRDNEGIFTLEGENPRRFGLTSFNGNITAPNYYLIGTSYRNKSIYELLLDNQVVAMGFCWDENLDHLYGKSQEEIVSFLRKKGHSSKEYSATKKFLQLKPGDMIALKSKGWPKGNQPSLEIVGYAIVVERDGRIYSHDPGDLGHLINVEFIETGLNIDKKIGGYGETIYEITDPARIEIIFDKYRTSDQPLVREKVRSRRTKRKSTNKRKTGLEARRGSQPYVAHLKHNEIQQQFYEILKARFPKDTVLMEEDFADIKRENENEIVLYEVKPYAWAEDCMREALGQLLSYCSRIESEKKVKIVVVGPYEPSNDERDFISYIKRNLNIDTEYISSESMSI